MGAGLLVLCACVHRAHAELRNTTLACDLTEISQAVRTAVRAKVARLSPWLDACEPTLAAVVGDDDAPDMPPDTCARVARQHVHAQAALRFAEEQEYWLTGERWHLLNPATLVHEAQQFRCAPRAWSGPALMSWTVSHSLAKRTSLLPLYENAENSSVQLLSPPAAERLASVLRTSLGGAMPLAEVRVIMQQTTNGSSMCAQLDDVLVPGMLLADVFRRQRGECTLSGAESWLRDRAWLHATTHNSLLASPPAQHTIVQSLTRDVNIFIISAELASLLALLPHRNATRMWHAVARSGVSQLQRAAREGGACALGDNRSTAGNELLKLISAATGLPMDSGSAQDEGCAVHDVWTDNADESAEVSGSHHLRVHASVFHESSKQPPTCGSMISTLIAKVMLQQAAPLTLHPGEAVFIPAGSAFMWTLTPASATPGSVSAEMLPPLLLLAHYTDATNWNAVRARCASCSSWRGKICPLTSRTHAACQPCCRPPPSGWEAHC
ncbi:hypothetical protein EON66_05475 [archaeon]|nr:MAG: hypothetical protein EON66_05475 [archaeon]